MKVKPIKSPISLSPALTSFQTAISWIEERTIEAIQLKVDPYYEVKALRRERRAIMCILRQEESEPAKNLQRRLRELYPHRRLSSAEFRMLMIRVRDEVAMCLRNVLAT